MNRAEAFGYERKNPKARLIDSEVGSGVTYILTDDAIGIDASSSGRLVMSRKYARAFADELLQVINTHF